mmetsp:Transcript_23407/g.73316  ORF Transcript_23407/g.73316 Transcript_23407/m.73316 type:complete len:235 (+) Transcript_23407:1869-2573(+)
MPAEDQRPLGRRDAVETTWIVEHHHARGPSRGGVRVAHFYNLGRPQRVSEESVVEAEDGHAPPPRERDVPRLVDKELHPTLRQVARGHVEHLLRLLVVVSEASKTPPGEVAERREGLPQHPLLVALHGVEVPGQQHQVGGAGHRLGAHPPQRADGHEGADVRVGDLDDAQGRLASRDLRGLKGLLSGGEGRQGPLGRQLHVYVLPPPRDALPQPQQGKPVGEHEEGEEPPAAGL